MGSDKVYVRGRHGSVRSCPTRTLDNYPMKYSHRELSKSVFDLRSGKNMESQYVQLLMRSSMNQKDYSKRMFLDSINRKNKLDNIKEDEDSYGKTDGVICEVFKLTKCYNKPLIKYSGPSSFGSPLYNKKPELLNQIRTQKRHSIQIVSESKPAWIDLRQHMKKANTCYKVERKNSGSLDLSVPTVIPSTYSTIETYYNLIPLNTVETDEAQDQDVKDVEDEINLMALEGPEQEESGIPLVMVEEPKDDRIEEGGTSVGLLLATDNQTRAASARNRQNGAKIRPVSPRSKSAKSRQANKVPRCWVDDATVSSEGSLTNNIASSTLLAVPGKKKSRSRTGSVRKCGSIRSSKHSKREKKNNINKVTIKDEAPKSVASDKPIEKEDEIKFPGFICPSSEEKSREAAVKDWLANVSFPASARHVPLL